MIISEPLRSFSIRMPQDWQIVSFESLMTSPVRNGIYKSKEFHGRGTCIINMGEIFAYDFISNQEMKRVELTQNEETKYCVEHGDLLFARRSLVLEGSGKCSIVINPIEKTTFESSIIRVRPNHAAVVSLFLFYLLKSPLGKAIVASIATRTAVSGIRGSDLSQIALPIPPLPTQRKIAAILSAYDDLIDNNTKRIKILEEMAQTIYNEWFVKFKFPGHENVKMVDSELGMIPEGWEVKKLGEVADINSASIKKGMEPSKINYIDISSVSTGNIDKIEPITFTEAPSRARRIVKHGDIVWSTVRPNRKSYSLILNPMDNLIVSTGFAVITPDKVPYTYLYHALTTDEFVGYLVNNSTGAAYPAVNSKDFQNAVILRPSNDILSEFHSKVEAVFELKHNFTVKNENLHRTRDLLLPRLISGEIDVSELDINVEEITA